MEEPFVSFLLKTYKDYYFDFVEDKAPYQKTEGTQPPNSRKVELRKGREGTKRRTGRPAKRSRRIDLEGIALDLVMKYERIIAEREPDDRHAQYSIGYDIYSSDDKMELFIEVKHFQGEAGTWNLTAHQWKMASKEKNNYFVYIVSHLRDDNSPTIDIIQNPVKYLEPNPPINKEFSNWKNGVIRTVATKEFLEEEL